MPELPEVEQVRVSLLPHIKGRTILKTEVRLPRMIHHPAVPDFIMGVEGRTITDVRRRGKYLTLLLDDGHYILAHLRMTGALLVLPGDEPEPPYAKFVFSCLTDLTCGLPTSAPLERFVCAAATISGKTGAMPV